MKIALLGYGTVGRGTADALAFRKDIEIAKVLDLRDIPELGSRLVHDINDIVNDPEIELVAELMGGEQPACRFVSAALNAGKHIVTSNKLMFSLHYDELLALARKNGVIAAFSATAGGGIPWLLNLLRMKRVGEILSVGGIMNGTTNYILDNMTSHGRPFGEVLAEAQKLGYAEADPTADIDGLDVKAKIALSSDCAWDVMLDPAGIPAMGIRYITAEDIRTFREMGLTCKLIGRAEKTENGVAAYVEPMLFTADAPEAGVAGAGNIISAVSSTAGKMSFAGGGAGRGCTGAAVAGDICDIAEGISLFPSARCEKRTAAMNEGVVHRYYIDLDGQTEIREAGVREMNDFVNSCRAAGRRIFAASFA